MIPSNRSVYLVFATILIGCVLGIYFTLQAGKHLEPRREAIQAADAPGQQKVINARPESGLGNLWQGIEENLREPLSLLLIQLILIVVFARFFAAVAVRTGEPAVIGEMIAGIVLGPSLLGAVWPSAFHFVFPTNSLAALRMLSQVGIILFMFVVGMEVDMKQLRSRARTALVVSHVSIFFPYFLGVLFSLFIYQSFSPDHTRFMPFALFMGIAMSITAFPVLARILEERGLMKTHLGAMALTCAAVGDVSAWTILAFVVTLVKAGNAVSCCIPIGLLILFIAGMLAVVKPFWQKLAAVRVDADEGPSGNQVVAALVLVFVCGLFTEVIGIHALFGAFMAGICMPQESKFRLHLRERLESFSSAFLLPLFFAFTGLRTQVALLNDWHMVGICAGLILLATVGKLGGSMFTAHWTGMNWRDSFALGALMNTRGLVELIVLNIGLDLHILSPEVFTMMVIMALVTTCLTGPLLSLSALGKRGGHTAA